MQNESEVHDLHQHGAHESDSFSRKIAVTTAIIATLGTLLSFVFADVALMNL